jgi:multiple sugar transport system substrate-binding protein
MRRAAKVMLGVLAAVAAAWWLFYLTPSRGAQRADTIRFGFWGDYQEYEMWKRVVAAFERDNPGIRVRLEHVPGRGSEYTRKLTAWMASDTSPEVMLLQDEPFPRYMLRSEGPRPVLTDLTALLAGQDDTAPPIRAADYWPTAWESFGRHEADGWRQYGLPVFGGNNLIFYNRDCFRRAGVPLPEESGLDEAWTVEQFVELARALTLRERVGRTERTVQWGFNRPFGWLYWLPFIYACDADVLNESRTEFIFTDDGARRALTLWGELYTRHAAVPAGGELGPRGENVAFLTGRVAMVVNGPWAMPFFNEAGIDYGVMLPPRSPTGQRGTRITWDCVGLAGRLKDDPRGGRWRGGSPASSPRPRRPRSSPARSGASRRT